MQDFPMALLALFLTFMGILKNLVLFFVRNWRKNQTNPKDLVFFCITAGFYSTTILALK
jgi:hypothetical protein